MTADATSAGEFLPVSADAHVNEPHDLWYERLPSSMRDLAPRRIEQQDDGGWSLVVNGDEMGWQKVSAEKAAELESERIGHATPEIRLTMMAEDGIGGEMIYPTIGLYLWDIRDPEVGAASCRIYNDWIDERLGSHPERIKLAGMIPTWDVDVAIAEVHRIAGKGFASAILPIVGTPPWNAPTYERLWDAIDETGLAITMHQGTGQGDTGGAQTQAPRATALLACSGVLERHPDLHVVLVEVNAGWLAWCMEVLDEFARAQPCCSKPPLKELPSHYIARQIHCTFQNDPAAIANLPLTGARTILWGNDYPHDEGTFPHSQKVIDKLFAEVTPQDRRRVLADNAVELFGFDPAVVHTPVEAA
jgi:predicted TIM-barrel fold metal-dependent hydrolase